MDKWINRAIAVVATVMVFYHLVFVYYLMHGPYEHQAIHFGFALVLVFLGCWKKGKKLWPLWLGLVLLSVLATGYVNVFYADLELRAGAHTTADIIIGTLLVALAIVATQRTFGWAIPIVAAVFLVYLFLGSYLPPPFYHPPFTYKYTISQLSIGLTGMFGTYLGASANYIFLYVIFGALLQTTGGINFFIELGKAASRKLAGGPAQTAVISSGFVGMVMGLGSANVALTGAFTIPMMKKLGLEPKFAGAVEAAASTGGQIMPPIMGASAFLMAAITGVPYSHIMVIAFLPATLYYLVVMLTIELEARRLRLAPSPAMKIDREVILWKGLSFIISLGIIIALLIMGYSPMFAAFWANISLIGFTIVTGLLKKGTIPSLGQWIEGLTRGAIVGASIGVVCGCLGPMAASMTVSGLCIKFSSAAASWVGGSLFLGMLLSAGIGLLLGCGLPTLAAYALVAILMAPVLHSLGAGLIQAHLFCLYFAVLAGVTPPIAVAALIASKLANASFIPTALKAAKLSAGNFLLPFFIILCPVLTLGGSIGFGIIAYITLILGFIGLSVGVVGYCIRATNPLERLLFVASGAAFFSFSAFGNYMLLSVGFIVLVPLVLRQVAKGANTG